jgi:hypothetical protein
MATSRDPLAAKRAMRAAVTGLLHEGITGREAHALLALVVLVPMYDGWSDKVAASQVAAIMYGKEPREVLGWERDHATSAMRKFHNLGWIVYETKTGRDAIGKVTFLDEHERATPEQVAAAVRMPPKGGCVKASTGGRVRSEKAARSAREHSQNRMETRPHAGHSEALSEASSEGTNPLSTSRPRSVPLTAPHREPARPEVYTLTSKLLKVYNANGAAPVTRDRLEPTVAELLDAKLSDADITAAAERCAKAKRRSPDHLLAEAMDTMPPSLVGSETTAVPRRTRSTRSALPGGTHRRDEGELV